jgi:hypothetical protein
MRMCVPHSRYFRLQIAVFLHQSRSRREFVCHYPCLSAVVDNLFSLHEGPLFPLPDEFIAETDSIALSILERPSKTVCALVVPYPDLHLASQ